MSTDPFQRGPHPAESPASRAPNDALAETVFQASPADPLTSRTFQAEFAPEAGDVLDWLCGSGTFTLLPRDTLRAIADAMQVRTFREGDHLLRQGEAGNALMVIQEGSVEVQLMDERGRPCYINRIGPPQVLGEMALLTHEPATASAVALSTVRVLVLPTESFHALARRHPALCMVLTRVMASRLGAPGGDVLSGKAFGGYRIVRRLASGGTSVIYEGVRSTDDLRVALKMMSHRLVYDDRALQFFQREADLIERFDHPHIVRLFGRFKAFHTHFIAMEFCDGEDLHQLLVRKSRLCDDETRRILGQLASALAYSHRAGVIHRDIKPSNIMLTSAGRALLVDFGLAKPSVDHEFHASGAIVGTPRYMAPEQLAGRAVSWQADYFSFGCVGYEMLTGRALVGESSLKELRRRHEAWTPPNVAAAGPDVSPELAAVIEGCLERDPQARRLDLERVAAWA
jgi:predicted Ser/Thr protein kinase